MKTGARQKTKRRDKWLLVRRRGKREEDGGCIKVSRVGWKVVDRTLQEVFFDN
jgi:hypothetical protein